jgi:hypothetical protein
MASRIRDIQEPLNLARSRQALSSTSCDLRHWKSRRPDHISRRPRSLGRPILGPASEHARRAFSWPRSALIRPLGSGKISRGGVAGSGPVRMYGCAPFFIATVVSGVAPAGVSGTRAGATGTQPGGTPVEHAISWNVPRFAHVPHQTCDAGHSSRGCDTPYGRDPALIVNRWEGGKAHAN